MPSENRFRVLVIDDEERNIDSFSLALRDCWDVDGLLDPKDLKNNYAKYIGYNLIFLDLLFDTSAGTSDEVIVKLAEKNELLGLHFLDWIEENHPSQAVAIYSGYLLDPIVKRIRTKYPHILLAPKPVDLNEPSFRSNMEYYARKFLKYKYEDMTKKIMT